MEARRPSPLPPEIHAKLTKAHSHLLTIHKTLLDYEKIGYEKCHGKIPSPGHFLQLLINDPYFAWLRKLSQLITQIDEMLEEKEAPDLAAAEALVGQSNLLTTPDEKGSDFQQRYQKAVQASPEVALAHGNWKRS